jgi:hypothetical protein
MGPVVNLAARLQQTAQPGERREEVGPVLGRLLAPRLRDPLPQCE